MASQSNPFYGVSMKSKLRTVLCAAVLGSGAFAALGQTNGADNAGNAPVAIKSLQARQSIEKAKHGADAAAVAYRKAMADLKRTELGELKTALAAATKTGNLDDANAIKVQIDSVAGELAGYEGQSMAFAVSALDDFKTVRKLTRGTYEVTAKGRWAIDKRRKETFVGPEGTGKPSSFYPIPNMGVLLARYGGKTVTIGAHAVLTLDEDADVAFAMADGDRSDNTGEVQVMISRQVDLPTGEVK
jgi:hypothetical protein